MLKRKIKIKYLEPRMKFNPGIMGFEPDLSAKNQARQEKKSWFWIILLLILVVIFVSIILLI
jgi:hypothetical protein